MASDIVPQSDLPDDLVPASDLPEAPDTGKIPRSLGQRLKQRGQQFMAGADLMKGHNPLMAPEAALRMGGAVAGGVGDILSVPVEGILGNLSKAYQGIRTPMDLPQGGPTPTPAGQKMQSLAQQAMQTVYEQARKHPRIAADVQAGIDVASMLPIGRSAKAGTERAGKGLLEAGEMAGARAGKLENEQILKMTKPEWKNLTKRERVEAFKKGGVEEPRGVLTEPKRELSVTKEDQAVADTVKDIVSPRATPAKNITSINSRIKTLGEQTSDLPTQFDKAYEEKVAKETAEATAAQAAPRASVVPAEGGGWNVRIGGTDENPTFMRRANAPEWWRNSERTEAEANAERWNRENPAPAATATAPTRRNLRTAITDAINQAKSDSLEAMGAEEEGARGALGTDKEIIAKYNQVRDVYLKNLKNLPEGLGSVFRARKMLDKAMDIRFGPGVWQRDSILKRANEDIRRTINDFVEQQLPEGNNFKALLQEQRRLYKARDNIALNAGSETTLKPNMMKKVWGIVRRHPYLSAEAAYSIGAGGSVGVGGAFERVMTNPYTIAAMSIYGAVGIGKTMLTSARFNRFLSDILKYAGNQLTSEETAAIRGQMNMMQAAGAMGLGAGMNAAANTLSPQEPVSQ